MKTTAQAAPAKRPVNLLLSEENVRRARQFTDNLSATVDGLLVDYIARQNEAQQARQQRGDAVADAWNRFHEAHGSFADEHSTL
ncbi:MAG: type II toxin-antitoxin system CcdA family antitoxin [Rhodocyclaceae bacterium]|jgi:antitoxin CcdA|nr:type II toxin-antitoxin system CcdA family antitoxin [Rhodocyclaceae bacterium]